jgi:acyl carrier protein
MKLDDFTKKIEAEIEDLEAGTLTPDQDYRELEQWSSMYALIVMALIDTEYDVTLSGEDLKKTNTIRDLFELVKNRN